MLSSVLHHVGLSCIISSNKQTKYHVEENNPNCLDSCPWYNTTICYKLNGTGIEYFIQNSRTDIYNIMCSINAHNMQQPTYVDDAISSIGILIPTNSTIATLKSIGATLNFIDCWLKHFQHNYKERL